MPATTQNIQSFSGQLGDSEIARFGQTFVASQPADTHTDSPGVLSNGNNHLTNISSSTSGFSNSASISQSFAVGLQYGGMPDGHSMSSHGILCCNLNFIHPAVPWVEFDKYERMRIAKGVSDERVDNLEGDIRGLQERLNRNNYYAWPAQFQQGVLERWDHRHSSHYTQVKVLSVCWQSDDLGVTREIDELQYVFAHSYGFQCERLAIPDYMPIANLNQKLLEFISASNDTLLIFSYHGHGNIDPIRHDLKWAANRHPNSPQIEASPIQRFFEEAPQDALLLFDACHSSETSLTPHPGPHGSVTELISACGFQTTTPGVGPNSFSHTLTQVLRMLSTNRTTPFSVSELFGRVLSRLRNTGNRALNTSPVHSLLTFKPDRRHIMLAPRTGTSPTHLAIDAPPVAEGNINSSPPHSEMRVMVSFTIAPGLLARDALNLQLWHDWLLRAPPEALAIQFQVASNEP